MELDVRKEPSDFELDEIEKSFFESNDVKSNDSLSGYLEDIGKYKLLSRDEEIELAQAISLARHSSDEKIVKAGFEAREKMILSNLKLVVSIAKKYTYSRVEMMDIIQSGSLGLTKAVDKYQVERGFKFSTYATWWIRQSITRYISNTSRMIRLPVYIQGMLSQIKKLKREYKNDHGVEPDIEVISDITDIPVFKLKMLQIYIVDTLSVDHSVFEDDNASIDNIQDVSGLDPDKNDKKQIIEAFVYSSIEMLPEREKDVIKMRYGIGTQEKSLEEVGQMYGITRERIRQIEEKAIKLLKKMYLEGLEKE